MYSKSKLFLLLLLAIGISLAVAQKTQIIFHKEMHDGDSLKKELIFDHDIDFEILGDSSRDHFIWSHEGDFEILGDSSIKNVFIHRAPAFGRKAARIVIKESGFFKKNKIIIDFDPLTRSIIKIVENDKDVPPKKFHKYQDYLEDATEFAELEALHPRMEELELKLEALEFPDPEMLANLETLIVNLEGLESKRAHLERKKFTIMKHVFELENLEGVFQGILEDAGITPPQKIETISIQKGKFFVNGDEVKGEAGEKCIQAYMNHSDLTPEDMQKKGEEISIDIRFD